MANSKKEIYLDEFKKYTLVEKELENYLLENSNLPGKRGNLELAFSFRDYIEKIYLPAKEAAFNNCLRLVNENPARKAKIGNEEFLPFCGIVGLGRIAKIDFNRRNEILLLLRKNAQDDRWRIREAVAMAIQEIVAVDSSQTLEQLNKWLEDENYFVYRAVAAGLAEPYLMKDPQIAQAAFLIHKSIIEKVGNEKDIKTPEYKALVKGLCYTLSVIILGNKEQGFDYLDHLITINNPIIRKIVRENLKKNRLKRLNESAVLQLWKKL